MKLDSDRNIFLKNEKYLFFITILLILNYGITPYIFTDILQVQDNYKYSKENLIYSSILILSIIPFFYFHKHIKSSNLLKLSRYNVSLIQLFICFILFAFSFYLTPWISDRESIFASINAIFKMFWFILVLNNSKNIRLLKYIFVFTIILMVIEQSRTYFLLSLFILLINIKHKLTILTVFVILTSFVALVRSEDFDISLANVLIYGLKGEAINGSFGVNQILSLDTNFNPLQILATFSQFIFTPLNWIFRVFSLDSFIFDSSLINSKLIEDQLNEVYYPLAGFYLLSEFIQYKIFGIFLMVFYLFQVLFISKKVFDTKHIPTGAILLFISIKQTPMVFWKTFYALIVIQLLYLLVFKFLLKNEPRNY